MESWSFGHQMRIKEHCMLPGRMFQEMTWGSGPLLYMARVLVPIRRLLILILNVSLLVEYYTLKQQTEIVMI